MFRKQSVTISTGTRFAITLSLVLLCASIAKAQIAIKSAPVKISNNDLIPQEIEMVYYLDSTGKRRDVNYRWKIKPNSTSELSDSNGRPINASEIGVRPYGMPGDLVWVVIASKAKDRNGYLHFGFNQRDIISLLEANKSRPQTDAQRERNRAINADRLRDANRQLRDSERRLEDMQRLTRENNRKPLSSSN